MHDSFELRDDVQKDIMYDARYTHVVSRWKHHISVQTGDTRDPKCPCHNAYELIGESRYYAHDSKEELESGREEREQPEE